MGAGQDVTVVADDDAAACAGLDLALAEPGPVGVDHGLGGDGHHAGGDQGGHLGGGQVVAAGGSGGRQSVVQLFGAVGGLDHQLVVVAHHAAHIAAGKANGCGQHQGYHRAQDPAGADAAALFGRLARIGDRLVIRRAGRLSARAGSVILVGGVAAAAAYVRVAGAAIVGRIIVEGGIIIFPFVLFFHTQIILSGGGRGRVLTFPLRLIIV